MNSRAIKGVTNMTRQMINQDLGITGRLTRRRPPTRNYLAPSVCGSSSGEEESRTKIYEIRIVRERTFQLIVVHHTITSELTEIPFLSELLKYKIY